MIFHKSTATECNFAGCVDGDCDPIADPHYQDGVALKCRNVIEFQMRANEDFEGILIFQWSKLLLLFLQSRWV